MKKKMINKMITKTIKNEEKKIFWPGPVCGCKFFIKISADGGRSNAKHRPTQRTLGPSLRAPQNETLRVWFRDTGLGHGAGLGDQHGGSHWSSDLQGLTWGHGAGTWGGFRGLAAWSSAISFCARRWWSASERIFSRGEVLSWRTGNAASPEAPLAGRNNTFLPQAACAVQSISYHFEA